MFAMVCPVVSVPAKFTAALMFCLSAAFFPYTSQQACRRTNSESALMAMEYMWEEVQVLLYSSTIPPMNMTLNSACSLSSDKGCPF